MTDDTPPDFYNSRKMTGDGEANRALFAEMRKEMEEDVQWFRFTVDESFGYLWVEGWKERPKKEAAFSPPYTAETVTGDL